MAARGARTAEGDAGDRRPQQHVARLFCTVDGRVPPGTERSRLRRGTECGDRIPLGGGPLRPAACIGRRSRPQGRFDRGEQPACGTSREKRDLDDPGHLQGWRRPVGDGLVASLARPGGNLTGVSVLAFEVTAKRLELLSELVPRAGVIALLVNPNGPRTERVIQEVQQAARAKGVQLSILKASTETEIDAAFASLKELAAGALLVGADPFLSNRREQLVALASRHAVPSIYAWREFAASGG